MRNRRLYNRPDPRYFDRTLSSIIHKSYPDFLNNIVPQEFKNKMLFDLEQYSGKSGHVAKRLENLGIEYKTIGYYLFISKKDWNLFKLIYNEYREHFYDGKEIGQLLLNEINDFLK